MSLFSLGPGLSSLFRPSRHAVLSYFGELGRRSQGSFKATVQDMVGGDNHTVGVQQSRAKNNGKTLDAPTVIAFVIRDGKVVEGRECFDDAAKADEFWA